MHTSRRLLTLAALLASAMPAHAAGTGGCESFDFPLATELKWMQQAEVDTVAHDAKLPATPEKAMSVTLAPAADVTFALPPEGKAKPEQGSYAAAVTIDDVGAPGLYQVSLSTKSWIDVIQGGKLVKSGAHTSKSDCDGLRKSVRFELGEGPVTLQITNVADPTIKVTVRKAQ